MKEGEGGPVIVVENLGKCYHIYDKPRDRMKQSLLGRWRTWYDSFWALRGVSFEVQRGDSIGILGRNGSGKSTLLQILAGTLSPSEGSARIQGRIAALLELGSGFHPEFTGRENVFLAGAILGITRAEMEDRFDEIAAFADIGRFIDQPVKIYSSGMMARLAFAVAVSVEPDILIVDEILAVGDMGFRQRCMARIKKLLDSGVTLFFVSHAPDMVKSLCQKGLVLVASQPIYFGDAGRASDLYFNHVRHQSNEEAVKQQGGGGALPGPVAMKNGVEGSLRYGTGHVQVESVRVLDGEGEPGQAFEFNDRIVIEVACLAHVDITRVVVGFLVRDRDGVDLMGTTTASEIKAIGPMKKGDRAVVRFGFDNCLRPVAYGVCVDIERLNEAGGHDGAVVLDHVDAVAAFRSIAKADRPIWHKVHVPVEVEIVVERAQSRQTQQAGEAD